MTLLQAIILGLIQGLTEFIPVSSSAHLIIVPWLFGWTNPALTSLPFDVALHLGTLLAVLAFFAADWVRLLKAGIASVVERRLGGDPDRRLAWMLVLGSIPGAVIGALAESRIEALFHEPNTPVTPAAMIALAVMLALMGAVLLAAERLARHVRGLRQLTFRDALLIGLAQALAIFPGVSRSGATITAGLFRGLTREAAARFSFLLSAPIIAGAGAKSVYDIVQAIQSGAIAGSDLALFPVGFVAAAISGYLCIRFLLAYLQRHSTEVFVYYRWALAVLIVAVALMR
jgi:undecaprenyl-diphosphatase